MKIHKFLKIHYNFNYDSYITVTNEHNLITKIFTLGTT